MTAPTGAARTGRRPPAALARTSLAIVMLALLAGDPAIAAVVDAVPFPHLRPGRRDPMSLAPTAPVALGTPAPLVKAPAGPLTQQQILANITNYFNSFQTMEGQFAQIGPNGEQSEGTFFMARPGRIRFHYRPPVRLDVIADGRSVAVRDLKAMTQDLYPLSKTPLRYLLAQNTDFTTGNLVKDMRVDRDTVSIVIAEQAAFSDGQITLIFDRTTYQLKQWIVTDAQGLNTAVTVFNVSLNKPANPGNFYIDLAAQPGGK